MGWLWNVFEWCQDWYGAYPAGPVTDPQGAVTGSSRVLRGGYWHSNAQYCRSAQRWYGDPAGADSRLGFRVLLAPR